jgi:hypothetical protein
MTKKTDQKTTQTRKNTVESPKSAQFFSAESSRLTDFSTPIYNMGVTTWILVSNTMNSPFLVA